VLPLEEALTELYTSSKGTKSRDRRTLLAITFDDGYRDNYTYAFELARDLQLPITLFLPTGYIESGDNFWWLEGERLVSHTQVEKVMLDGVEYHPSEPTERAALVQAIDARLRGAQSVTERETFLAEIRSALAVPLTFTPEEEAALPMSWEQVRELAESQWVQFGAHSVHHPVLSRLTDPAEVQQEVSQSRLVLEKILDRPVKLFAYPIGKPEDIGEEAIRAVKDAGYSWAVTTASGVNTPDRGPHQLLRFSSDISDHWLLQAASISDVWKFVSPNWRKTYRAGY